jgi:hypothetical protein
VTAIWQAIANTPIWVFPLILVVLVLGARNLQARERSVASLFVLPVVMLALAIVNLTGSSADLTLTIPAAVVSFLIGCGIGWNLVPRETVVDRAAGTVHVPSSVSPLLVVIAIVILRYAIGYIYGRWPELRGDPALALEFGATGALLAGIVWGRILRLGTIYRRG